MRAKDLIGERFGRLIVVGLAKKTKRGQKIWDCKCDCGNRKNVQHSNLASGHTKSCGCLGSESRISHSMWGTDIYFLWHGIKSRCLNKNHSAWRYYGGRGIGICEKWLDFSGFYEDMGERPGKNYSIDRVDNNGPYEKKNCRWVTQDKQLLNRRNTVRVEYNGEVKPLKNWVDILGLSYSMVLRRLKRGWDVSRALEKPSERPSL